MKKIQFVNLYSFFAVLILIVASISGCVTDDSSDGPETIDYKTEAVKFLSYLFDEEYQLAWDMFDNDMKDALQPDDLQQNAVQLQDLYGNYLQNDSVSLTMEDNYNVVYIYSSFSQGSSLIFKVVFDENSLIAGFFVQMNSNGYITPTYVDETMFTESDVVIGSVDWELPATITMPKGNGPFPAVVLVQGSGASDRDETIGQNKPFKDIAWGLASNGVAVIRYDKRTYVYGQEVLEEINTFTLKDETVDDAVAAIGFISSFDEVDSERIYVLGHSLGGYALPLIASYSTELDGIISMAGNVRPIEDLIMEQVIYLSEIDDNVDATESASIASVQILVQKVKDLDMGESEIILGASRAYWTFLATYDPIEVALTIDVPILILQGERDYQVTMEDFTLWKQGLNDKATYISYPTLDHMMFPGTGVSVPNDYYVQNNVFEGLINDIIEWISVQN